MHWQLFHSALRSRSAALALAALGIASFANAAERGASVLVLTSSNDASANSVLVFRLQAGSASSLSLQDTLATGGRGGASGNAGSVQFRDGWGAVANFGSNSVTQLRRVGDHIAAASTISLASGCVQPDSVALRADHLFVVGANCAESHAWPGGGVDGGVVALPDNSAGQIAVGRSWGAVTLKSGSVVQLPLNWNGSLSGSSTDLTLPSDANNTPLGAAFWDDLLGFDPAHSTESLALVDRSGEVFPVTGPAPAYPSNAPCWIAKGPGNIWYTGNSPGHAISIFLTDAEGGVFYKSIALPGAPTDITVSPDKKWLAVIYSSGGAGYVAVYSIDVYGDLTWAATSDAIGIAAFNGVAFSE